MYHKLCEPITYALSRIRLIDLGHCSGVSYSLRIWQPAKTLHIYVIGPQCNEKAGMNYLSHSFLRVYLNLLQESVFRSPTT